MTEPAKWNPSVSWQHVHFVLAGPSIDHAPGGKRDVLVLGEWSGEVRGSQRTPQRDKMEVWTFSPAVSTIGWRSLIKLLQEMRAGLLLEILRPIGGDRISHAKNTDAVCS